MKEFDRLKLKAQFVPVQNRKITYLLASRSGFTDELAASDDLILITGV